MSFDLLQAAKGLFTNELTAKAGAYLGEKESSIRQALNGIVPAVLGLFAEKTATAGGTNVLAALANEQLNAGTRPDLSAYFTNDGGNLLNKGATMASGLFGNKLGNLTDAVSGYAGIKPSSTASLLGMAVPALLAVAGRQSTQAHNGDMAAVFEGHKLAILKAVPAGLNLNSVLNGWGLKMSDVTTALQKERAVQYPAPKKRSGFGWLILLSLLALSALVAWYFMGNSCSRAGAKGMEAHTADTVIGNEVVVNGRMDTVTGDWWYNEGENITIVLPNGGGNLDVGKFSTEAKLFAFLTDTEPITDTVKGNWFELTNVHFKTGSAEITDSSKKQLDNLALICKAFNTAQFKLGGYTDSTGSTEANIAVSQKRAEAVLGYLKNAGVRPEALLGAKGYGPEWPVADNATAEGRAQNRRVAVNVKAK